MPDVSSSPKQYQYVASHIYGTALHGMLQKYPLMDYSAKRWQKHAVRVEKEADSITMNNLVIRFLDSTSRCFRIWSRMRKSTRSTLQIASRFGLVKAATSLLDTGTDVNTESRLGETPLLDASTEGHATIVRLLLDRGTNVNKEDHRNQTPSSAVSSGGHEVIVRLLLDRGAEVNAQHKTREGSIDALEAAIYAGHTNIAQILIDHGADVRKKLADGRTALHNAAKLGAEDFISSMIGLGADINAEDIHGWTPCAIAYVYGHAFRDPTLLGESCVSSDLNGTIGFPPSRLEDLQQDINISENGLLATISVSPIPMTCFKSTDIMPVKASQAIFQICANHPMPAGRYVAYFEVTIFNDRNVSTLDQRYFMSSCLFTYCKMLIMLTSISTVGIGISGYNSAYFGMPGWDKDSWGYHGDNGEKFDQNGQGTKYGPLYGDRDTVGCGVDFHTNEVFFTKNGSI